MMVLRGAGISALAQRSVAGFFLLLGASEFAQSVVAASRTPFSPPVKLNMARKVVSEITNAEKFAHPSRRLPQGLCFSPDADCVLVLGLADVLGRERILAGIAGYLAIYFGKAFARVFGQVEKRPLVSADEQPPPDQ